MLAREPVATTSAERDDPTLNFLNVFACGQGSVLAEDTGNPTLEVRA
jgi:hypothetical protein